MAPRASPNGGLFQNPKGEKKKRFMSIPKSRPGLSRWLAAPIIQSATAPCPAKRAAVRIHRRCGRVSEIRSMGSMPAPPPLRPLEDPRGAPPEEPQPRIAQRRHPPTHRPALFSHYHLPFLPPPALACTGKRVLPISVLGRRRCLIGPPFRALGTAVFRNNRAGAPNSCGKKGPGRVCVIAMGPRQSPFWL